jgi:hypothetical protein
MPATFRQHPLLQRLDIEQLAIMNNEIYRAGATAAGRPSSAADGILFDHGIVRRYDLSTRSAITLIDRNLIQFNTRQRHQVRLMLAAWART